MKCLLVKEGWPYSYGDSVGLAPDFPFNHTVELSEPNAVQIWVCIQQKANKYLPAGVKPVAENWQRNQLDGLFNPDACIPQPARSYIEKAVGRGIDIVAEAVFGIEQIVGTGKYMPALFFAQLAFVARFGTNHLKRRSSKSIGIVEHDAAVMVIIGVDVKAMFQLQHGPHGYRVFGYTR